MKVHDLLLYNGMDKFALIDRPNNIYQLNIELNINKPHRQPNKQQLKEDKLNNDKFEKWKLHNLVYERCRKYNFLV